VTEEAGSSTAQVHGDRNLFDPAIADFVKAQIVLRDDMIVGATATGPAVITEDETTIIVPTSFGAVRQPDGCIDLRAKG
jgi:N-methylhydantoinase A